MRDFHFIMDVNNSTRRPKEARDRSKSQLRNIYPVIASFVPSEQDWVTLVEGLGGVDEDEECENDRSPSPSPPPSPPPSPSPSPSPIGPQPPPNGGSGPLGPLGPPGPSAITLDSDSDEDSSSDDDSGSGPSPSSGPSSRSNSTPSEGDLVVDDSRHSRESSQTTSIVPMVEMLNLRDDDHHGEYESDDESTIVPDNQSVTDLQVVDLTNEGNGSGENNSESQLNSTQFSSSNRLDSPLFVDDGGYVGSYTPSLPERTQDGRHSWEIESNQATGSAERSGSESSLFVGTAPTYMNQTSSRVPTLRQGSPGSAIEAIDLTGPDDLIDSFLPSDNLNSPPVSRKRSFIKVEEDEEDEEDDMSTDTPNSSKRVCTLSPALSVPI